jgi:CheY-like chemotaxis protein
VVGADDTPLPEPHFPRLDPPPCRPLRLLVAEDNSVNQKLLLALLERQGHAAVLTANGREALEALEREAFDAVLLDVQMPEVDGLEVARRIRANEAGSSRRLPLLALTAHAMKGDRERCLAAGMDDYLAKPLDVPELYRMLAEIGAREAGCGVREDRPHRTAKEPIAGGPSLRPPPPAPRAPILDRATALARVGGDEQLLAGLVGVFRAELPGWLTELRQAVAAEDGARLRRAAHTLKGAVSTFGAAEAVAAALRLEQRGRDADLAGVAADLTSLEQALSRLGVALHDLAAGPAPSLEVSP